MKRKLKIYYTSDTHGYFYPTTYGDMEPKNVGLFSCVSDFKKDDDTLIIDGGDSLQGNAFAYYANHKLKSSKVIADVMNDCGYDYFTLGNHDFNYGLAYQKEFLDNHNGLCLCQNIEDLEGNILYPYIIKEMPNGLKVGMVGIVTDYINIWEKKENLVGIKVVDPFKAAKLALDELKGKTDINICIYHGGFEADLETGKRHTDSTENVGYKICKELTFDLLLTGHQHMSIDGRFIEGNNHRTYVVQPTYNAKEYHYIEIEVDDKEDVNGNDIMLTSQRIQANYNNAKQAVSLVTGENLYNKYISYEEDIQEWLNEVVGRINIPLLPKDKLTMALEGSVIADFFNKVQLYFSGADISCVGLANEIAGFNTEVTTRNIIATYPYPNTLLVLRISGADLKPAMERSAEYFAVDSEGKPAISTKFLVPKLEHYNYDYFAGVDYKIDITRPEGDRITKLSYKGMDVEPNDEFNLVLNNYRASGAGEYPMYPRCKVVKEINTEMVELLMEYFNIFPEINI